MTSRAIRYDTPVTLNPVVQYGALFVVAAVVLIPLLATVLGGFKSLGELRVNPFGLPTEWEWRNYWEILVSGRYWQPMWERLLIPTPTGGLPGTGSALG